MSIPANPSGLDRADGKEAAARPFAVVSDPSPHPLSMDGAGGEGIAARPTVAVPEPSNVAPLPRRRTYLDACREQGVFQKDEETRAEIFETRTEIEAKRLEVRRKGPDRATSKPVLVVSEPAKARVPTMDEALAAREAEVIARLEGICLNYQGAGLGDAHFPLLMTLLFKVPITLEQTTGLFEAALRDLHRGTSREEPSEYEERRLNGEGLNVSAPARRQPSNQPPRETST